MPANTGVATSAGSTFSVVAAGAAPAAFDAAGYAALTWVPVGEITDLGEFGREYNLVTHNPIGNRATQKYKGSFNEGTINLQLGLQTDDVGQIIVKAALISDLSFAYRVVTQNGDAYYFQAQCMSFKVGVGSVDQITGATVTLELTTSSAGVGIVESLVA
jgi:hypothetical protein